MTQHNDAIRLRHMLDYSRKATAMMQGRTREELNKDEVLYLALTRVVEILEKQPRRYHRQFNKIIS